MAFTYSQSARILSEEELKHLLTQCRKRSVDTLLRGLCSVENPQPELVELVLSDERCEPTGEHLEASVHNLECFKLLLKDGRARPTLQILKEGLEIGNFALALALSEDNR